MTHSKKRRFLFVVCFLLSAGLSYAQEDLQAKTQPIVEEGKRLYRSEMASWYGTDIFLEQFKDRSMIGGYFSYAYQNRERCIFFSRADTPMVIGTISFDSTYNVQAATADLSQRNFTPEELAIYTVRTKALNIMRTDTLFKRYENMELNLIPMMTPEERKVYVLTGPKKNGVVIFGNDYLLTFDSRNQLVNKRALHKNIIQINYSDKTNDTVKVIATIHTHTQETGDFITATDICTLMLYEKFAKWDWHYTMSKDYVCMWNCQTDQLITLTKKAFNKIYK